MSADYVSIIIFLGFIAYVFVFEYLGRLRHIISAGVLVISLTVAICLAGLGMNSEPALAAAVLFSGHGVWELGKWLLAEGRSRSRSRKRANLPARRHKRATTPYTLSNEEIISHFAELAKKDDLAVHKPAFNFLAWNTRQGYVIQVFLLPEGGWTSIFWSPADFEMRDKEITAACRAANVPCHKKMLGMRAQGIAIAHAGQLTITPADQQIHFDEFLHSVLAPEPEFTAWLKDYHTNDN